jgi:FtsP/CotA-like multicopper oxidase with cupredoxin domain
MKTPVNRLLAVAALLVALPAAAQTAPGQTPDYFGIYPNYASSPLPVQTASATPTVVGNPLIDRAYATDFPVSYDPTGATLAPVLVTLPPLSISGTLASFLSWNQATAGSSPNPSGPNSFHAYLLRPTAPGASQFTVVYDSGLQTVPAVATSQQFVIPISGTVNVQAGDVIAFYGQGVPVDTGAGSDVLHYPAPTAPVPGGALDLSGADANYPTYPQARTYSFGATVNVSSSGISGGMVKFKDALPDLAGAIATPEPCTYSGQAADCYTIRLKEVSWQFHADLPPAKVRSYVQVINGVDQPFHYLGPVIVAQKDKPVRVTFINALPTGAGGDLFIPVDETYMGAGAGPNGGKYTQNRASVHLHGGTTPWISDGTIHQWTTPAGETTPYPAGVSVYNVPDMPNPGKSAPQGTLTFYYTNQQSARLMFYHDHALGITRLNVYAGEAAGYLVTDPAEQDLITRGVLPGIGVPLVLQDRTFVPESTQSPDPRNAAAQPFTNLLGTFPSQLAAQDPTWDVARWGGFGSLWFPHVYMPNQNPGDLSGANAMGRWDYGPWFWPPFTNLTYGPVANPYYDPACVSSAQTYCQGPQIPGTPDSMLSASGIKGPSGVPESFMDTPVVNGKAYPTLTVPAGKVRFRILNAANDRYWNLSFFVADAAATYPAGYSGPGLSEVKMVPFNSSQNALKPFPAWWYDGSVPNPFDDRVGGVPDPDTRGPAWIQVATDGGWLPGPAVIKNQPVNYVMNKRDITVGNVKEKALFVGPAERADVVVDFSKFAGKTLILYNDSPAPVPAADPRLDYFTGDPDQSDTGGAPSTLAGYGPNTRTVMQIKVAGTDTGAPPAVDDYDSAYLAQLQTELPKAFAAVQDPIIVPQAPYDAVYGQTFPGDASVYVKIQDTSFTFRPLGNPGTGSCVASPTGCITVNMYPKSLIEDFQTDYGRMNAILGNEIPNTNVTNQTSIPQTLVDPPVELVKLTDPSVSTALIGTAADGTQIWKFTHNGVDTHAIHFHMFNVQILNRVGWDGAIKPPDANELGFKDTVRMNPLEDLIVATRAIRLTSMPFKVPNSIRLLDPTQPAGGTMGFTNVDPNGNPVTITNQLANFGWEYVYHCHLLGHEENDMMRPLVIAAPPERPIDLATSIVTSGRPRRSHVVVSWKDVTAYTDPTVYTNQTSWYRVFANNTVGSTVPGYPNLTATSLASDAVGVGVPTAPAAPANLTATILSGSQVRLNWTNTATNATSVMVESSVNGGAWAVVVNNLAGTATTYTAAVSAGNAYQFRVSTVNAVGTSVSNTVSVTVALPAAPASLAAAAVRAGTRDNVTLTWTAVPGAASYRIQRATNATFTAGLSTSTAAGTAVSLTQTRLNRNASYYYRIQAVNGVGGSAFTQATPFPIVTP